MTQHAAIEHLDADETSRPLSDMLARVERNQSRVLVERGGAAVAAIISVNDLAQLEAVERGREERFAGLSRISRAFANVPLEELEQEVERSIREGRSHGPASSEPRTGER